MNQLEFDGSMLTQAIQYSTKPVINIIRINYQSDAKDWVMALSSAILAVKISLLDENDNVVSAEHDSLALGGFITPDLRKPILEINKTFRFSNSHMFQIISPQNKWRTELTLNNVKFNNDEKIVIEYIDTNYTILRVDDWVNRVRDFISQLTAWAMEQENITVKAGHKQSMNEEMMRNFAVPSCEIESADVFKNGKLILAVKPFGLWLIGANGRIDILSSKGNYIIVDRANNFQTPSWYLHLKNDRTKSTEFTKDTFYQILQE